MKKVLPIIIVLVVIGVAVAGLWWMGIPPFNRKAQTPESNTLETSETQVPVSGNSVEIKNFAFDPKTITIKMGESVTWTNSDIIGHTATADDGSWDTGIISNGKGSSITFDQPGTYTYHCTPHPFMKGTIIVTK